MTDFLYIIGIISAFGIISSPFIIAFYQRNFKSYEQEINELLTEKNQIVVKTTKPIDKDWDSAPFPKPKIFDIKVNLFSVGQTPISLTEEKFLIIESNSRDRFWIKVSSTLFQKPQVILKEPIKTKRKRTKTEIGNLATFPCPACKYPITRKDEKCPDCELNLI